VDEPDSVVNGLGLCALLGARERLNSGFVRRRANLSPAALAGWRRTSILTDSHEFPSVCASVAQLAEQLICNQQVVGSSPSASSSSEREREVRRANGFRIGRVV
jgi:hypothetical protein